MGGVRGRGQERRGRGARGRTAAGGRAVLRALGPPAPVGVSWGPGCRVGCGLRRGARLRRVLCVPARAATPLSPHRRLSPSAPLLTAKARPAWKPPSLRALPFPAKSGSALALPSSQAERNSAPEPQIPVHFAGQLFSAAALSTAEPCEAPAALLSLAVCCVCGHRLPTQGTSGTPRFSFLAESAASRGMVGLSRQGALLPLPAGGFLLQHCGLPVPANCWGCHGCSPPLSCLRGP